LLIRLFFFHQLKYIKISNLAGGLRNDVMTIFDLLSKNLEVLVQPRGPGGGDEHMKAMY
jgi:hypothetical protein